MMYVAFKSNVSGMVHGKDFSLWESEKSLNGKDFHATPSHQKEGWPKGCLSLRTQIEARLKETLHKAKDSHVG